MTFTARQQQIIDISVRLIADKGIQQLTIRNIAGELGFTEPAVYRHFESKFAILSGILDSFAMTADDALAAADPGAGAWGKIERFIRDRFERMAANPPLAKVMFSEETFQYDERLSERMLSIMHEHRDALRQWIAEGQVGGELRGDIEPLMLFRLIMGPVRLLIRQWGFSGYKFDLLAEGSKLCASLKLLLQKQNSVIS